MYLYLDVRVCVHLCIAGGGVSACLYLSFTLPTLLLLLLLFYWPPLQLQSNNVFYAKVPQTYNITLTNALNAMTSDLVQMYAVYVCLYVNVY